MCNLTSPTLLPLPPASSDPDFPTSHKMNRFDQLVDVLRDALGESSGLTSDDVDIDVLSDAMARYVSEDAEWSKYALPDSSRGYTRNLVDEGNGKSNLVSCCQTPSPRPINCLLTRMTSSSSSYGPQAKAAQYTTTEMLIAS